MTSEQMRAARAMLRIDQKKLADLAGVSVETIKRLEKLDGEISKTPSTDAIEKALHHSGVILISPGEINGGGGPGVRLNFYSTQSVSQAIVARMEGILHFCLSE